jgi:uncharacterized membrane protein
MIERKKGVSKKFSQKKENIAFEKIMEPIKTRFGIKNIMQAIVGAVILAIPIGFTEETWRLGETLPLWNVILLLFLSIAFIGLFAYRNFSRNVPNFYWYDLAKRILWNYVIAFLVVAVLLSIIQRAPWSGDFILALKRTIIVAFPASLSATIAGNLK